MLATSKADRLLRWFFHNSLPNGVHQFEIWARRAAEENLQLSPLAASTYVNSSANRLWTRLSEVIGLAERRGIVPILRVVDYDAKRVESSQSWLLKHDSLRNRRICERLDSRPFVLSAIDQLTDRQYEALCVHACQATGATFTYLTPKSNEGGIDFVALLQTRSGFPVSSRLRSFRVIGQAKMYSKRVSVSEVREFNDTMEDVRRQSPTVIDQLPEWFRTSSAPIVGWLVGHSGFQSGSELKARMNSIALHDTLSIAETIVFSRHTHTALGGTIASQNIKVACQEIIKQET